MMRPVKAALIAGLAALTASNACAEAMDDMALAGDWSFVANTGSECTFSGNALLFPGTEPGKMGCELTAVQVCNSETWQVRQTCTAVRDTPERVIIISQIEEFIQGSPDGRYKPDNFTLYIKNPNLMTGVLASWGFHFAEFRRQEGTIS